MPRFYVTMTWDDWPEGGSYGTVIEASSHEEAERLCRLEMADTRADPDDDEMDADHFLNAYGDEWVVVDCFDLDEFIRLHSGQPASQPAQ